MPFPFDMTKLTFYEDYADLFLSLLKFVASFNNSSLYDAPLTLFSFTSYWVKDHHMLKVAKLGSELCGYCTTFRNAAKL